MILSSISEINQEQWANLLAQSSTPSFFQSAECYHFYASLSYMKPFVYGVSENNELVGILCGYIIADGNFLKQFFSRRAIVPGGLLLSDQISVDALQDLLKTATKVLAKKAIYLEIRNYNNYSLFRNVFENSGFNYQAHLNFHVSTVDLESVSKKLSSSKRRQIKQSINAGATVEEAQSNEEVHQFYAILKELYQNKVKSPLFSVDFFEKLIRLQNAKILVVKYNGKVIGGIAIVLLSNISVSEWFVCGIDGVEKNLYPSVLATYAGIEYAVKNGFDKFDFMGAGKPDEDYGVREFKSKFGGVLLEHGRFLYVYKPMLFYLGKYIVRKLKQRKN